VIDSWLLNWLVANGTALVNRASQPAIDLLTRALEHVPRTDPRREVIESRLVAALRRMLRFREARELTRAVLASDGVSAGHRLKMSWALAYSLLYSDPPAAAQVARQALADDDGGRWGARLQGLYAVILAVDGQCGDPAPAIRAAHAAAERTGDSWTAASALQAEAAVNAERNVRLSTIMLQRALAVIGDNPRTSDVRTVLQANLIVRFGELGQPDDADAAVADMLAFTAKFPSSMALTRVQVYAAEWHCDTGRWDDALAEVESVEMRPEYGYLTVEALGVAALIAGHRDDRAAAAAHLAALDALPIGAEIMRNHSGRLLLARALAAERDGRPDLAFGVLAPMLDPELNIDVPERLHWLAELVRLAIAAGDRAVAGAATRLAVSDAEREGLPLRTAVATACRGLLAGDPALLADAAEQFRTSRRVLACGMALENAAVLLAERGELPAARTAVAAAIEEYGRLAAVWDLIRAESRMRPFGIRRGQRGPRGRPSSGWGALTPTELRVAFLVADGLSNPDIATELFLSRRTVQTHVSHILAKLGARSRAEVAGQASGHRHGHRAPVSRSAS
jgi:DNA-binding CsgD family transcriptional regulator